MSAYKFLSIIALGIIFFTSHFCALAQDQVMVVTSVKGNVSCMRDGERIPLKKDMTLNPGDSIETAGDSSCDITMGNTSLRIKEKSFVTVEKIKEKLNLLMQYGAVLTKIKDLPENAKFEIRTPQAVIGARGTRYKVYVDRHSSLTRTSVVESSVDAYSLDELDRFVTVTEYQETIVQPWNSAIISAKGTGILSEKILGELAIKKMKTDVSYSAYGDTRQVALSNLTTGIGDLRIDDKTTVGDVLAKDAKKLRILYSFLLRHARFSNVSKFGRDLIKAEVAIDNISRIMGRQIYVAAQDVYPISESEYAEKFGALARVTTSRAAKVDAFRKLAEIIYGAVITSSTTLEDYVATDDTIKTRVTGIVQGAEESEIEYFSDGGISITVRAEARSIKDELTPVAGDIFGRRYIAKPSVIKISDFEEYLTLQ
jgi:hypothetical protein